MRRQASPTRSGRLGSRHRAVDIFGAAFGDPCNDRAIERVDDVNLASFEGIDPGAIDIETGFKEGRIDRREFRHWISRFFEDRKGRGFEKLLPFGFQGRGPCFTT
jgi:hypothetical protein